MTYAFNPPQYPSLSLNPMLNSAQGIGFTTAIDLTAIGTGNVETPLLYLVNDTENKVSICSFQRRYFDSAGSPAIFRHYSNPIVSDNGSPLTIHNLRFNPNSPQSVMASYESPTVTDNGNFISAVSTNVITVTSDVPYIIDPGYSILITAEVQNDGDMVTGQWIWWELAV